MAKHCVHWKPIKEKTIRGSDFDSPLPTALDHCCRGQLLSDILAMEKKQPISFEKAALMVGKEFDNAVKAGRFGRKPGQCHWYTRNFVKWISDQGYHIELTGDEFEPYQMTDKIL